MINLARHQEDFGIEAVWNYFATSHGKGPCNGIGGTVKRLARIESLRRIKEPINTFHAFTQFCLGNFKNIEFHVISSNHLQLQRPLMDVHFASGATVPGTRSFHQITPTDVNAIACKRLSGDDFVILKHQFGALPTHRMYQDGKYVVVVYDQDWYVGLVEGKKRG